jgi:hypothetical protein
MLARIITPIEEANIIVGVVWMDCDFPSKPGFNDQLTFNPQGKIVTVQKIIPAPVAFTPRPITFILVTSLISYPVSSESAEHSVNLLRQGWYRENETNFTLPTNDGLLQWLQSNLSVGMSMSWARAVTGERTKDVCPLNHATIISSHIWDIRP